MRSSRARLILTVVVGWCVVPAALGQTGDGTPPAAPAEPLPKIRIVGPQGQLAGSLSPDVTDPPPRDDFVVIPLRAHILSATDLPAVQCGLTEADIHRIVTKVNGIWHKAGIHWALDPIVHEPAANQDEFRAARDAGAEDALGLLKILAPAGSRAEGGMDVYYIHAFAANGVFLGDRTAFVQETARLRAVPGGIDEPLPRVTSHELGHALGLPHRESRTNLLASGTTGTRLNQAEVDLVRRRAAIYPGAATVPDLRRRRAEARARTDAAEAARLDAILQAIGPEPAAAKPTATP